MTDYSLLDCGAGRKLERFGDVRVVRPAPAAEEAPRHPAAAWAEADVEYVQQDGAGEWRVHRAVPEPWRVECGGTHFELACASAGQVGLFPEQTPLRRRLGEWLGRRPGEPARVLDLFGYTGGSTLAAAAAGAEVTYVDGARAAVARMRGNLALNGLADAPVRSLAEDAMRFVVRETRRERTYDVVILDPPSYGRGPDGATFHIGRDLDELLGHVRGLLLGRPALVVATAHTKPMAPSRLAAQLSRALDGLPGQTEAGRLTLRAESGAELPSGVFAWREVA